MDPETYETLRDESLSDRDMINHRTLHQMRVDSFMREAGQAVPSIPVVPPNDVRRLRAHLILEEAFETVEALGFTMWLSIEPSVHKSFKIQCDNVELTADRSCNIVEVVDGCCDVAVVTTGTLSAFGVSDYRMQLEVDMSNHRKFAEGSYKREDGKWMKPPEWQPPNISPLLLKQGFQENL